MRRSRGTGGTEVSALEVTRMRRRHLRGVLAIERRVYARPWSPNLFAAEIAEGIEMGARAISLEVRVTNWAAQRIYARFGFRPVGIRRNYYQEVQEDALIMWTDDVRTQAYRRRLDEIEVSLPEGVRPA
jgi:hypothetical protein